MQCECGVRIFSENRITLCVFEDKQAIPLPAGITSDANKHHWQATPKGVAFVI